MKKSPLVWFLLLAMLMSLATVGVFAQEEAEPEQISESAETEDSDGLDEPVAEYVEYPCTDADGNVVEAPFSEEAEEAEDVVELIARQEVEDEVEDEVADEDGTVPDCVPVPSDDDEPEEPAEPVGPPPPPINPWYGQYWNNPTFSGVPAMQRTDDFADFNWGDGSPNEEVMGADWNSIRWTHTDRQLPTGFYRVRIKSDFGARLDVNGARIVDTIRFGNANAFDTYFWIRGGLNANYRFDYFHHTGPSVVSIDVEAAPVWSAPFGYGTVSGTPVLRDGPGTEYFSNGRLAAGQSVKLTGHRNLPGNWLGVVTDDGEAGWLSTASVLTSYPIDKMQIWPFTPDGVRGGEARGTVSRDFPYVNVRYEPRSQSQVIAQAPQGMSVALIGRTSSNNYLLVRMWEGTLGWAPRGGIDTNININALPVRYDDTTTTTE